MLTGVFSKKDDLVRRQELLDFVFEDLSSVVANNVEELMRDPLTIQIVQEIILDTRGIIIL